MITSLRNPLVRDVVALHRAKGRRGTGLVLLEGPTIVEEAIGVGVVPEILLSVDPDAWEGRARRVEGITDGVLSKVATTRTPQDPVAVISRPRPDAARARRLVAWGVSDPGNLGAMIRTAAAVDIDVAVGGDGSADPWSPKAVRAAAGAHFRTAVVECGRFDEAVGGRPALALVVDGGTAPAQDPEGSWALVVGSEAHGLPGDVVERCQPVTLPMPGGTESLNAAVAAGIALYTLAT